MSDTLDWLNYNGMIDDTQEILTTDKWDITFDKPPAAVYWPGDQFLKFRIKSVSGLPQRLDMTPLETEIRGFHTAPQPGQIKMLNSDVSFEMIDYEDQTIFVFITDWLYKCCDPVTQKSYRAADLRANLTFNRLNSLNQPVRRWKMKAAIISTPTYEEVMDGERSLNAEGVTLVLHGMVFPPEFLNLPA